MTQLVQKNIEEEWLEKVLTIALRKSSGKPTLNNIRKNLLPDELEKEFDLSIREKGIKGEELLDLIEQIVEYSVDTSSPLFMNQMWGNIPSAAAMGDMLTTLLNTSMYTYEVAPLMTLIEKECIKALSTFVWKDDHCGDGVFTPGGSISNINAMVLARNAKFPESASKGISAIPEFSVFISKQTHYSFAKGAAYLGFGRESIVEIETNESGQINITALEHSIEEELSKNKVPLMLIGVGGLTATGEFDDLESLAAIAKKYGMWYHVDAAYGGSLLFSENQAIKFNGVSFADSITWNLHKIIGIPLICSVLLTREKGVLNHTFSTSADYLFHDDEFDYDLGQKSLQCGRRVDALKLWLEWKQKGTAGLSKRVDTLVESASVFAKKIKSRPEFDLLCEPKTPIVCFRYLPDELQHSKINPLNQAIRERIFEEGEILFNYITLDGKIFLRFVITHPEFSADHMDFILETVLSHGKSIIKDLE